MLKHEEISVKIQNAVQDGHIRHNFIKNCSDTPSLKMVCIF